MFLLSKAFLLFANPGFWVPVLLITGTALLWTRRQRLGRWILTVTVALVASFSIVPIGNLLSAALEDRFPSIRALPAHIDGIVVLGGSVDQFITRARGQPSLTEGAERLTEFVAMARRHPEAKLAFTGGSGDPMRTEIKETEVARMFFEQMGLDVSRVVFEEESRNTWENAVYTRRLLKPRAGETWVLITSAQHMPRSVGAFRKAGWDPLPYPVDYTTYGSSQHHYSIEMVGGLASLWLAMRDRLGLIVYYALDRTDALFPGPTSPAQTQAAG